MAARKSFLIFIVAVLALVQSIEPWLPPYYPGYIPGINPGYNPYVHGLPYVPGLPFIPGLHFVPGYPGAPPPYYDGNRVNYPSSAFSLRGRTENLEDRGDCPDPQTSYTTPPRTPFLDAALGAFSPVNWLFRKWSQLNIPPPTTHYYNIENGNGFGKLKTWSWQF